MSRNFLSMLRNLKHTRGKVFFSETGEDVILQQLFKSKVGRYLDIGSGQPVVGSNSYLFYKMGWNGVCIDPQPNLKLSYKTIRPRDLFLPYIAGDGKSKNFYEFDNKLLSTTNPKVAAYHRSKGLNYKISYQKSIKLKNYLPKVISPDDNFFITIDIEGSEYDVIREINFRRQRPRAVLVETWQYPWSKESILNSIFYKNNYQLFAYTGLTALYIPNELDIKTIKLRSELSKLNKIT